MRFMIYTAIVAAFCSCAAPETSRPIFKAGVIESYPPDRLGEWRIDGRTYLVTDSSDIESEIPPVIGNVAKVRFRERGGVPVGVEITPESFRSEDVLDGPYCLRIDPATVEVIDVERGEVRRSRRVEPEVPLTTPPSTWDSPSSLLAVSDIEGNHDALLEFLKVCAVLDDAGRWSFGTGHLLFNGDIVDRGHAVAKTLNLIRRLEGEAQAAGGQVHFVLGNHEAMVLAGDLRYVHTMPLFAATRIGMSYDELVGTSEIGRWLRSKNSLVKVGPLLFVHAGYSPQLDALGLTMDEVNQRIRSELGQPKSLAGQLVDRLAWDKHGPLWYRGYFDKYAEALGGKPADEEHEVILRRHGVAHIVVGHTDVDSVDLLDPRQRLLGIDVIWSEPVKALCLLYQVGQLSRVDARGQKSPLGDS